MKSVKGKIEIINHPIIKGKNGRTPLGGDLTWKYVDGVMTRPWMIGGRKSINLPFSIKSVEISEAFSLLGALKKSNELTPESMMLGVSSPLLMMLYQEKKFKKLISKKVLIDVEFNDDFEMPIKSRFCGWTSGFMGYTTMEVFAQLHDLLVKTKTS